MTLVTARGSGRMLRRTLFVVCAGLLSLYSAEAALPVLEHRAALRWLDERGASPVDRRDKIDVIRAAVAAGVSAVSVVEPKSFLEWQDDGTRRSALSDGGNELHPLSGLSYRPSVMCNEMGEWITWTSDRYGMNNPDEVWDSESVEVALVGDAFTNGWCASPGEHFAGVLTEAEQTGTVVNLGQSGNGPLLTLASLVEYGTELRPEVVLWFHYELNEFPDLDVERRSPLLMGYLDGSSHQRLIERQEAIDREVTSYLADTTRWAGLGKLLVSERGWGRSMVDVKSFVKLSHLRTALGATGWSPPPADHALWSRVLARARETVAGWDGRLVVVYLPAAERYVRRGARPAAESTASRIFATLDSLEIPWIDPTPAFAARDEPSHLFNPIEGGGRGHYTEEAHRIVGEAVLTALEQIRE